MRGKSPLARRAFLVLAVVLLTLVGRSAGAATLTPELLAGVWEGQIRSCDASGCVQWESGLTLTILPGDPLRGTFFSPEYHASWPTTVETVGDEVFMSYRETRLAFHLAKRSGHPSLEASYDGHWLWYPRHNTVHLVKISQP